MMKMHIITQIGLALVILGVVLPFVGVIIPSPLGMAIAGYISPNIAVLVQAYDVENSASYAWSGTIPASGGTVNYATWTYASFTAATDNETTKFFKVVVRDIDGVLMSSVTVKILNITSPYSMIAQGITDIFGEAVFEIGDQPYDHEYGPNSLNFVNYISISGIITSIVGLAVSRKGEHKK